MEQWTEHHVTELNVGGGVAKGVYRESSRHAHFPWLSSLTTGNRTFSHCVHFICKDWCGDTLDRGAIWPQIPETVDRSPGPFQRDKRRASVDVEYGTPY